MTVIAEPTSTDAGSRPQSWRLRPSLPTLESDRRAVAEGAAVALALGVWLFFVTPRAGGREPGTLVPALVSLLPALILTAPWRRLSRIRLFLPLGVALSAVAVCIVSPYAWSGASSAALWGYGATIFLVTAAFASTGGRRLVVLGVVAGAGLLQFASGWLAWWGGGDPTKSMIGTFYYENTFGAFALSCGAVAAVGCVLGPRRVQALCWSAAPLSLCAAVLSTTRTVLLLLVLLLAALAVIAAWDSSRRSALPRWAGLVALTFATYALLTSTLVFPGARSSASGGFERRAAESGSLDSATSVRLDWWRAAAAETKEYPLAGGGFGSYRRISGQHMPPGAVLAANVHNQMLEGFAEGGLLFGLPLALAILGLLGAAGRAVVSAVVRRSDERWMAVAAGSAVAVLLAHSFVDFDLIYPSALGLAGILGACVPAASPTRGSGDGRQLVKAAGTVGVVLVSLVAAIIGQAHFRQPVNEFTASGRLDTSLVFGLADPERAAKQLAVLVPVPYNAPEQLTNASDVRLLLARTARITPLQTELAMRRAVALAVLGESGLARETALAVYGRHGARTPFVVIGLADVLRITGDQPAAMAALAEPLAPQMPARLRLQSQLTNVLKRLLELGGGTEAAGCGYRGFLAEFGPADAPAPPSIVPTEQHCEQLRATRTQPTALRLPIEGSEDR